MYPRIDDIRTTFSKAFACLTKILGRTVIYTVNWSRAGKGPSPRLYLLLEGSFTHMCSSFLVSSQYHSNPPPVQCLATPSMLFTFRETRTAI
jgi:hypothetical protein